MNKKNEITPKANEEITVSPIDNDDIKPTTDPTPEVTPPDPPEQPAVDFMNDPNVIAFIEKQIQQGIKKALQGLPPKTNPINPSATEQASFERMTYKERLQLFQSNPQSYYKLKGGN